MVSPCPDDPPVQADPRELTRCCALGLVRETEAVSGSLPPRPRLVRSRVPLVAVRNAGTHSPSPTFTRRSPCIL